MGERVPNAGVGVRVVEITFLVPLISAISRAKYMLAE